MAATAEQPNTSAAAAAPAPHHPRHRARGRGPTAIARRARAGKQPALPPTQTPLSCMGPRISAPLRLKLTVATALVTSLASWRLAMLMPGPLSPSHPAMRPGLPCSTSPFRTAPATHPHGSGCSPPHSMLYPLVADLFRLPWFFDCGAEQRVSSQTGEALPESQRGARGRQELPPEAPAATHRSRGVQMSEFPG